jgi:hypothetical protein
MIWVNTCDRVEAVHLLDGWLAVSAYSGFDTKTCCRKKQYIPSNERATG